MTKTNVMRILDKAKIPYEAFEYSNELTDGVLVANALKENTNEVFKTLVTEGIKGEHFVFVIPVSKTLDLKLAAMSVGAKAISMLKQKDLFPLTGYIHGGCSPIGMKKPFKTVIDKTAQDFDKIFVSAGKVGYQIKVSPKLLSEFIKADFFEITVK